MTQEFVTLPREVVEQALEALLNEGEFRKLLKPLIEKSIDSICDALEQPDAGPTATTPAGWKLVPVEPTEKMVDMGRGLSSFPDGVYRAMLAAAPKPPAVEQPTGGAREAFEAWCHLVGLMQQSHGIVSINSHTDTAWLAWQAAIANGQQPQANQPAMTPIAQRKLEDLMASGYTISGYSIYHEQKHQHGFVTGAGLVGWWKPEGMEYPQPLGEQEPVAWCALNADRSGIAYFDGRPIIMTGPIGNEHHPDPLYTKPQPKRKPLTDEEIDKLDWGPRPDEPMTFKEGLRDFARSIEAAHNIK